MVKEFAKVSANTGVICILKESLDNHPRLSRTDKQVQKGKLQTEIEKAKSRITNARWLTFDKDIEDKNHQEIRSEYKAEIEKLEQKIDESSVLDSTRRKQIVFLLRFSGKTAQILYGSRFDSKTADTYFYTFQKIIFFSEISYRTIKFRSAVSLVCSQGNDCMGKDKKKSPEN